MLSQTWRRQQSGTHQHDCVNHGKALLSPNVAKYAEKEENAPPDNGDVNNDFNPGLDSKTMVSLYSPNTISISSNVILLSLRNGARRSLFEHCRHFARSTLGRRTRNWPVFGVSLHDLQALHGQEIRGFSILLFLVLPYRACGAWRMGRAACTAHPTGFSDSAGAPFVF